MCHSTRTRTTKTPELHLDPEAFGTLHGQLQTAGINRGVLFPDLDEVAGRITDAILYAPAIRSHQALAISEERDHVANCLRPLKLPAARPSRAVSRFRTPDRVAPRTPPAHASLSGPRRTH